MHDFSKTCDHPGCADTTVYKTHSAFRKHQETHAWDSSTTCLVPACEFTRTFATKDAYLGHLSYHHQLKGKSAKPYIPQPAVKLADGQKWNNRICPIQGCRQRITGRTKLLNHLTDAAGHGLTEEDASSELEEMLRKSEESKAQKAEKRKKTAEQHGGKLPFYWGTRRCPVTDCGLLFKGRNVMLRHLTGSEGHNLQEDEANASIDEMVRLAEEAKAKKEEREEPVFKKRKT